MALFADVRAAVAYCYRMETELLMGSPQYGDAGSKATNPDRYQLRDGVAQGAMIRALIVRTLSKDELYTLDALRTHPVDASLSDRKNIAAHELCVRLMESRKMLRSRGFWVIDTLREWTGVRRHHTDVWWAEHYEVSDRTLRRWRNGDQKNGGMMHELDDMYNHAMVQLDGAFYESGLTTE